mmetsp:Transcript_89809/g.199545  ORF Transcript_89809/g.199545 Transcript_89809/m.199545 type:complete len:486 (+) Transcript_89809:44-1501(+)
MRLMLLALAATVVTIASAVGLRKHRSKSALEHPWPHARGPTPGQFGITDVVTPHNLSTSLAWSWHHPDGQYHTVVAGGPVIDSGKNLYLTTADGIRKFSPDGSTLWHYKTPGGINNMPSLMGDYVYGNCKSGHAFALDQNTGKEVWVVRPSHSAGSDSGYPAPYDGLFVMGTDQGHDPRSDGGNKKVIALDGKTGKQVWEYKTEYPVWNVMPLFPGDDSCVFMDFTGGVYRVGLHNGTQLWHAPAPGSGESFSDGGAILGSNDIVYACSNPGSSRGSEGTPGVLRAFQLSDGKLLWEQMLPQPCNSYPSVGHLGGSPDLSVVITPGAFMGTRTMHGGIMAFDAFTGMPQWQFQAPVYHSPPFVDPVMAAYGDYQGVTERAAAGVQPICLPAHWSCPTITGDGAVLAGRSDGNLYAIRGPAARTDGRLPNLAHVRSTALLGIDYATSDGVEAEIFEAKGASLHGASAFAPGMMAFSTCDTLYVFKF